MEVHIYRGSLTGRRHENVPESIASRFHRRFDIDNDSLVPYRIAQLDRRRRVFVHLVFGIYWLSILEGVLRKWMFPEWSKELFFVKDPVVLLTYLFALHSGMRPRLSGFFVTAGMFAAMAAALTISQFLFASPSISWLLAGYGLRNYFLYLPLTFFIGKYFKADDVDRLCRQSLLVSMPFAVLVFVQYSSPAEAAVNAGATGSFVNPGVGLTPMIRTYGTFTSSAAANLFNVSIVSMLLVEWLRPREKGTAVWLRHLVAAAAVVTCVGLSGSRGAVIWSALVIAVSVAAAVLTGRSQTTIRAILAVTLSLLTAFAAGKAMFPLAVDSFSERWVSANSEEVENYRYGIFGRALLEPFSFLSLLKETPSLGYGVGAGGNAAALGNSNALFEGVTARFRVSTREELAGAETDWGRHILDFGPVIGIGFILFRVIFAGWLCKEAIVATRRSRDPGPAILCAFSGILLLQGQIVALGTAQSYGWLFAGLTIAMCKVSDKNYLATTRAITRVRVI